MEPFESLAFDPHKAAIAAFVLGFAMPTVRHMANSGRPGWRIWAVFTGLMSACWIAAILLWPAPPETLPALVLGAVGISALAMGLAQLRDRFGLFWMFGGGATKR